ncbi:Retrovirus-related Pol polyprotein from transposon RE1 [Glycine soja]|uniref:Retrovirus-related Pol polyprotein from transposon RE1 n=1 Tax=Glycine soja TaxID=3848 RepID=A0A445G7Y3_GLYSO|nr:Retrovirus-related Pol polyprotein from transposon RE1 [Glycine soja]
MQCGTMSVKNLVRRLGVHDNTNHTLIRQDKLIYLDLLVLCDFEARSVMVAADTSCDAWLALACSFSNRSHSIIMSLRERLSSITKGSSSISTYLPSIRNIADKLALIGHPIDNLEMVIQALNGLGPTFREFTASIHTRDSPIAFNELYDKMVDFEMFLQRQEHILTSDPNTSNLTQHHYN